MALVLFEALDQTLRLRLVSGPVDKKFFLSVGIACPIQYNILLLGTPDPFWPKMNFEGPKKHWIRPALHHPKWEDGRSGIGTSEGKGTDAEVSRWRFCAGST